MKCSELVYELLTGVRDAESEPLAQQLGIENMFDEGAECERLYAVTYDMRRSIAARLGTDTEDGELHRLICAYEQMQRIIALKMFEYGVSAGRGVG